MESSTQSQLEMIANINTAIHLGRDENYKRAVDCMRNLCKCRAEIATRCRNYEMSDESRDLYYQLLEEYNNNIKKLLGL